MTPYDAMAEKIHKIYCGCRSENSCGMSQSIAAALREAVEKALFEHSKQHVCFRPETSQVLMRVKAEALEEAARVALDAWDNDEFLEVSGNVAARTIGMRIRALRRSALDGGKA
jgi:hypothetical protein